MAFTTYNVINVTNDNSTWIEQETSQTYDMPNGLQTFIMYIISFGAILNNLMVFYTLPRLKKKIKDSTRSAMLNLAVTDTLLGVGGFISRTVYVISPEAFFKHLCAVDAYFNLFLAGMSIFGLGFLNLDKFLTLAFPLRYAIHMTSKKAAAILIAIWITLLIFYVSFNASLSTNERYLENTFICFGHHMEDTAIVSALKIVYSLLVLILPVAVCIISLIGICCVMKRHRARSEGLHNTPGGTMIVFSRPLVVSFAITHVTTLAAYVWRLLGKGCGVKSYCSALASLLAFTTASGLTVTYTQDSTTRYACLVVTPVLALLHFRYFVRPAYVNPKNKAVFITGCDSGLGRRLALRLDSLGIHVFAGCQFSNGKGQNYLKENASTKLHTVQVDVSSEESIEKAKSFVKETLGEDEELWCVVNNAGVYKYFGELDLVPVEVIEKMMNINYFGTVKVTKSFLSLIRCSKGRIVNVTSGTGPAPLPNLGPYSSTKAAVEAISQTLQDEMHKWGVSVSIVRPGPYSFPEHKTDNEETEQREYLDFLWKNLPETTKKDYGREYLDKYLTVQSFGSSKEPTEVINDLEDAVMSKCPQYAYTSGLMPKLSLVLERCFPSCWRQCPILMRHLTLFFQATPAALKS